MWGKVNADESEWFEEAQSEPRRAWRPHFRIKGCTFARKEVCKFFMNLLRRKPDLLSPEHSPSRRRSRVRVPWLPPHFARQCSFFFRHHGDRIEPVLFFHPTPGNARR